MQVAQSKRGSGHRRNRKGLETRSVAMSKSGPTSDYRVDAKLYSETNYGTHTNKSGDPQTACSGKWSSVNETIGLLFQFILE